MFTVMSNRPRNQNTNNRNNFGAAKKTGGMNNHQNRNRLSGGGKNNNYSGSLMNQVNPWLSQSGTGSSFGSLGRNLVTDPQAQLALASNLLNNLLSPSSQLNKLAQVKVKTMLKNTPLTASAIRYFYLRQTFPAVAK